MIKEDLKNILDSIISKLKKEKKIFEIPNYTLNIPPSGITGDLSTNLPFLLSKQLNKIPLKVAEDIVSLVVGNRLFKDIKIDKKGFINFIFTEKRIKEELKRIWNKKSSYSRWSIEEGKRVLIEFVSANPTGPLHIGHGRSAALGDTISNVLEEVGYTVTREYYVNDIGNQINLLVESVKSRFFELRKMDYPFPEGGYKGEYIFKIAKEIKSGFSDDRIEKVAINKILDSIKEDLELFRVKFDIWFFESSLYKKGLVESIVNTLKKKGFLYEKDEALWFLSSRFYDDKDRVILRRNKKPTYLASDIGYHANKYQRGFDQIIDIWGSDHHGYIERVRSSVTALGNDVEKLKIIIYQMVHLFRGDKRVAMSTRKGEFVTLREVIDEVGVDACRFFFLSRSFNSTIDFDLELAKKKSLENPVYYIQYAYARISSILREAKKKGIKLVFGNLDFIKEKEELELIKTLAFFPSLVKDMAYTLEVHHLTDYLLKLAKQFHSYYNKYRVLSDNREITLARLTLVVCIRMVMEKGLNLLKISAPERM